MSIYLARRARNQRSSIVGPLHRRQRIAGDLSREFDRVTLTEKRPVSICRLPGREFPGSKSKKCCKSCVLLTCRAETSLSLVTNCGAPEAVAEEPPRVTVVPAMRPALAAKSGLVSTCCSFDSKRCSNAIMCFSCSWLK